MRVYFRPLAVATIVIATLIVATACSGAATDAAAPSGPWSGEYRHATSELSSDFERAVFSDGTISASEYRESLDRYITCMVDRGYAIELDEDSGIFGYLLEGGADSAFDDASGSCRVGNNLLIEPLYVDSYINPTHDDFSKLIAECLVDQGIVDAPFTAADVEAALAGDVLPWPESDPVAQRCLSRPVR